MANVEIRPDPGEKKPFISRIIDAVTGQTDVKTTWEDREITRYYDKNGRLTAVTDHGDRGNQYGANDSFYEDPSQG